MATESTPAPLSAPTVAAGVSGWEAFKNGWFYRFILFPLGQIFGFILGAAVILTLLAYLLAFLIPEPRANINLAQQVSRQLPDMIIGGVSIGFVYAMIALGYTLVYGVLKFINFAHSEFFMVGSVVGFEVMQRISNAGEGVLASWNPILLVIVLVIAGMLVSGTLAVIVERVAYRPLRGAPRLVPLISAIGVSFLLIDVVRAFAAITRNDFNLTYPINQVPFLQQRPEITLTPESAPLLQFWFTSANRDEIDIGLRMTSLIIIIAAILMLLVLNWFVNGTKQGRGIRAVSQDMATAGLMGINANLMISLTFFLGGAFGGAAGVLYGMNVGTVTPFVGFIPGLTAFTAAVLGGIGNMTGALLGGLALGLIETYLNGLLVYFPVLGQRFTPVFTFSVLILVLLFRPAGILGQKVDEKV
ncbi:MAG: branched-chain amino acid ABC transporter permease [Chloroflexota bacterium]|nr:branched-chain amino acid ABC transporter permease [Chloroflexota bacterium]